MRLWGMLGAVLAIGCAYSGFEKIDRSSSKGGSPSTTSAAEVGLGNGGVPAQTLAATGGSTPVGTSNTTRPTQAAGGASPQSNANRGGATGSATLACKATHDTAPKLTAPTSLDPTAVARAAVVLGSCWPDDGVDRNATHLWTANLGENYFFERFVTQLSCLANAACGCSALERCLGARLTNVTGTCSSGCLGTVFTICDGTYDSELPAGLQFEFDCSRVGQTCDRSSVCASEALPACSSSTFTPTCDAKARPLRCDHGVVVPGPSCTANGLDCTAADCVGRGSACTSTLTGVNDIGFRGTSCSGRNLISCVGGRTHSVDCASVGPDFGCQVSGGIAFCGLANQCVPSDNSNGSATPPSCSGTVLTFCNAGRIERIDCKVLGFEGCEVNRNIDRYGCIDPLQPASWKLVD